MLYVQTFRPDLHRHYLRGAPGTFERFYGVFRRESPHEQCQLAIGCHLDWSRIRSSHVFRSASATSVYLHHKLDIVHVFILTQARFGSLLQGSLHFFEIEYTTAIGLPHSMQRAFDLNVISPQDGHILWPDPATSDFVSWFQRGNRTVNSTTSRPKEILPALIKSDPYWGVPASTRLVAASDS